MIADADTSPALAAVIPSSDARDSPVLFQATPEPDNKKYQKGPG